MVHNRISSYLDYDVSCDCYSQNYTNDVNHCGGEVGICFVLHDDFIVKFGSNGVSYIQIVCFGFVLIELIAIVEFSIHKRKNELEKNS